MSKAPLRAAALGLGAGVAVTLQAHRAPLSPWWEARVGSTRLRRSDLPLGGAIALIAAIKLARAGHPGLARASAGLGLGAALGAVGTGLAEPLPPVG